MSFTRVKPDGWAVNEELGSAQITAIDINQAKAVDKTGDTITGTVAVGSGALITCASGGKIAILSGGVFETRSGANANILSGSFLNINVGASVACLGSMAFFDGTFVMNGGSTFELDCPATFNGVATHLAGVTFEENITLDSATLFVTSGSGIGVHGGAGVSWANTANATFQSGATATFQGGSFLVHSSTSTDTYASGSLLEQVSGSVWDLKGSTTFTPTSIVYFSFGNSVGFASTPTFFAGFNATTGGTAAFAVPATFSGTLAASGATTLSGATTTISSATTTLSGASVTLSAANGRLKLTSRNVERKICLARADKLLADYSIIADSITIGATSHIAVDLDPPDGSTMSNVVVTWTGTGNVTMNVMQNAVVIATLTTSSPGTHTLTTNCTVLRESTTYRLTFVENASNIPTLTVVKTNCLVTEYDDG